MLALAALAATGALGAACLGARTAAELLLTAYVIAWAQVVVVALLLSPFELVTRAGLALGLAASTGPRRARLARPRPAATAVAPPGGPGARWPSSGARSSRPSPSSSACAPSTSSASPS